MHNQAPSLPPFETGPEKKQSLYLSFYSSVSSVRLQRETKRGWWQEWHPSIEKPNPKTEEITTGYDNYLAEHSRQRAQVHTQRNIQLKNQADQKILLNDSIVQKSWTIASFSGLKLIYWG